MKNRHETPVTTPQFGCNSLMHGQMQKIMSGMEACFVSICVYFCLNHGNRILLFAEHVEPV